MLIRNDAAAPDPHVDFVPMVDVLFNLLIFFLLATTMAQAEREMGVTLPYAANSAPISAAPRELVVSVDAQGQISIAGRTVSSDELTRIVRAALDERRDQKVSVRGDRRAAYADIAAALDACKAAGVQDPYLDTTPMR